MDDGTRRLVTLETMLFWEGGFTVGHLSDRLGMRREHVQRSLIPNYRARNPRALQRESRAYANPPKDVVPLLAPEDPADLFNLICAEDRIRDRCIASTRGEASPVGKHGPRTEDVVALTTSRPDTGMFRALHMACASKTSIVISYMSRRGPIELKFSPHTLVRTAWRLHFRGHAIGEELSGGEMYVDLVPSRVLEVFTVARDYVSDKDDLDWHAREDLTFALSVDLPEDIRRQAFQEYMSDTVIIPRVRKAIASYVRRAMMWRVFRDEMHLAWMEQKENDT